MYEVTAEKIVAYCRAARYENLVYNNQPAAREAGLPGIIAPPAMVFAYAPVCLGNLVAAKGCCLPQGLVQWLPADGPVSVDFESAMVVPSDVISSVTSVDGKCQGDCDRFITFRVEAHNQHGELVAGYLSTYRWPTSP